ncbi:Pep7p [Saccharomyces cerevisiae x Saccharomyces kudriavzevii VIN7]|uniref:Pep7p n=1 Tax=Saccharomyces cerevisiae x Saccharomyces kudriavzevii (strain VIN7) TaxID=1095631 RepID=H0GT59_SACCK|nr:Pep7p [Saccharomyces cerevisiae x Saccharomyces kudriavzevii VIN7]
MLGRCLLQYNLPHFLQLVAPISLLKVLPHAWHRLFPFCNFSQWLLFNFCTLLSLRSAFFGLLLAKRLSLDPSESSLSLNPCSTSKCAFKACKLSNFFRQIGHETFSRSIIDRLPGISVNTPLEIILPSLDHKIGILEWYFIHFHFSIVSAKQITPPGTNSLTRMIPQSWLFDSDSLHIN